MTIVEAATIYQALAKFSELFELKFNDALNIIKLKNSLKDYYELFDNKKRLIFKKYALKNNEGQIQKAEDGSVMFKTKEDADLAVEKLLELNSHHVNSKIDKIKITMPEKKGELTLQEIEMLALVIDFE